MRRLGCILTLIACAASMAPARRGPPGCGTTPETPMERLFLHRQALRRAPRARAAVAPSANRDIGNIAVIEDAGGVVARQNDFNLDGKTLRFSPQGLGYQYTVSDGGYDAPAAAAGAPLAALDDDDTRLAALPFPFPFYGATYRQFYVNSDGNLTFTASDTATSERSLGRMTAGPPRVSPLFDDLDPALTAGGVRILSEPARVVVSWVAVPEWAGYGSGPRQTFQAKLYPDGAIEFSYSGVVPGSALVGIAPGGMQHTTALVDYRNDVSTTYTGAVAERFGNSLEIDVVTAAQQFYRTHEDAYDYLVIYNNMNIPAMGEGVVAYESTVRSRGTGYGVAARDDGLMYGSPSRLESVLNMGPLGQYPADPGALVPARAQQGDTPLTTIGHEAGHLFLAYASVRDPNDPTAHPMLGYQNAHWAFTFNSDASLLEGERILDQGPDASPRFVTTATVQGYSALDQYLMGFRPPSGVPDTFYVTGAPPYMQQMHPLVGVKFDGARQDVSVAAVIQAMGRRTPDSTIAQRRFRFGFVLVVPQGTDPSASDLAKLDAYRQQFEAFYSKAASDNATADTALRRSLEFSLFPAAGIVAGGAGTATLTVAAPATADTTIRFQTVYGYANFPAAVTLPAGATSVTFPFTAVKPGVEEVTAVPGDPAYETAFARVQVAGAEQLILTASGNDPVVVRLTDANGLRYAGARILAAVSAGGGVTPQAAVTDARGEAAFQWEPGPASANQLQLALQGLPSVSLTLRAGSAVPVISAVVNSASYEAGVAAGALETIFGANLAGGRVLLNGAALPVAYAGDSQINFYVPPDAALGAGMLSVQAPSREQASAAVTVAQVQPGIFGVVGSAAAGDYLAIYCTGLGPTKAGADGLQHTVVTPEVFIGAEPVQPVFSGLSPGTPGLYQVNVRVPPGLPPGRQNILFSVDTAHSNAVSVEVP